VYPDGKKHTAYVRLCKTNWRGCTARTRVMTEIF
jgi:hypothetical protein